MHGGVLEYLYMFLKNFKSEDYENILIVSQDYEEKIDRFKEYVSEIHVIPMIRDIKIKEDIKSTIKVRKLLKQIKPDILYLHSSKAGAYGRIAMFFNRKTKILYNAHGWYFNANIGGKKKKAIILIEKILAIRANKIINISKSEYDSAIKYKIAPEKKMCIIENCIDFKKFAGCENYRSETRKKYNIKDNEVVIGVVGRLSEQKDPMTTIKAFNEVHKNIKNVRLMYVGSGDLESDVLQYAKENNIENLVTITGWVDDAEKYIPAFDIAVLPSKWEGFGLAILEYMACKKPIVASKVGGMLDIIKTEENGFLIDIENANELAKYIEKYITDGELYKKVAEYNYNYSINNFNIDKLVEEHKKIISTL